METKHLQPFIRWARRISPAALQGCPFTATKRFIYGILGKAMSSREAQEQLNLLHQANRFDLEIGSIRKRARSENQSYAQVLDTLAAVLYKNYQTTYSDTVIKGVQKTPLAELDVLTRLEIMTAKGHIDSGTLSGVNSVFSLIKAIPDIYKKQEGSILGKKDFLELIKNNSYLIKFFAFLHGKDFFVLSQHFTNSGFDINPDNFEIVRDPKLGLVLKIKDSLIKDFIQNQKSRPESGPIGCPFFREKSSKSDKTLDAEFIGHINQCVEKLLFTGGSLYPDLISN